MSFHQALATFHQYLAISLVLDQVVLGIWALRNGLRHQAIGSGLFSAIVVDEGLIILESALGGILFGGGHRPQPIHFLYGALLLGLLPVVYPSSTRRRPERAGIWLGVTLLFMAGLIVRAYQTGQI